MLNFLLGRSTFKDAPQIIQSVKNFDRYEDSEHLDDADAILIFKSEIQQCWLVFTSLRMYFVVDDSEKGITKAVWARDKQNIIVNGRVSLHIKEEKQSKETGKLLFGKMNNSILYTYALFNSTSPAGLILDLAEKHFLEHRIARD